MQDADEVIYNRRHTLANAVPLCPQCGSVAVRLVADAGIARWLCRACRCSFIAEPGRGPVLLPDRSVVSSGRVYTIRRDVTRARERYYELEASNPLSTSELVAAVRAARSQHSVPPYAERPDRYDTVKLKRGGKLHISHHLPERYRRLWKQGVISAQEAYAAAMYVYFVKMNFLLHSVGTNFPKHEKVSGGGFKRRVTPGQSLHVDAELRAVLDYCLVTEGRFADVPGVDMALKKTSRHHEGKAIMRSNLRKFSMLLERKA